MEKHNGFGALQRKLDALIEDAGAQEDGRAISVTDLLTDKFVADHTSFTSATSMLDAASFSAASPGAFVSDEAWDAYVRSISRFDGWRAMLAEAVRCWALRRLGLESKE